MSEEGFLRIIHRGKLVAVISMQSVPDEPTSLYVDVEHNSVCNDMIDTYGEDAPAKFEIILL